MLPDHETLVYVAKVYGLVFMFVFFVLMVVYTYWPTRRQGYKDAAASILAKEDRPQ